MIYVILGMHKSGTTLVSKTLHKSGINMGFFDENINYDQGNQYEREETLFINNELLNSHELSSLQIPLKANISWNEALLNRAKALVRKLDAKYENWGFKDPRTCLTYDFWDQVLPDHKIIVVYRNPNELLKHYKVEFSLHRFKSLRSWFYHNSSILRIVEDHKQDDVLFIKYDKLFDGSEELNKIRDFLSHPIADLRKPALYRNRHKSSSIPLIDHLLFKVSYSGNLRKLWSDLRDRSSQKTVLVYYGILSDDLKDIHLSSYNKEIVESFRDHDKLKKLICYDYRSKILSSEKVLCYLGSGFARLPILLIKMIKFINRGFDERDLTEYFFDLYARKKLKSEVGYDRVLFMRPTNPKSLTYLNNNKKLTVGISAIFPRRMIANRIAEGEAKWGIKEKSNYTKAGRIREHDSLMDGLASVISLSGGSRVQEMISTYDEENRFLFPKHEFDVDKSLFHFVKRDFESGPLKVLVTTDDTLKKGLLEFLEALQYLDGSLLEMFEISVIGKIGTNLRSAVNQFTFQNIQYYGYTNKIQDFYFNNHIYICPSIIDMGPRTLKQAMATGMVVISNENCGATSFIAPYKSGLVFPDGDNKALADLLTWCSSNRGKLSEMGENAFKETLKFDNRAFANEILGFLYGQIK